MTKIMCNQYEVETNIIPNIFNGVNELNEAIKLLCSLNIPNSFSPKKKIVEFTSTLSNNKSSLCSINDYLKTGLYKLNLKNSEMVSELENIKLIEIKPRTEKL